MKPNAAFSTDPVHFIKLAIASSNFAGLAPVILSSRSPSLKIVNVGITFTPSSCATSSTFSTSYSYPVRTCQSSCHGIRSSKSIYLHLTSGHFCLNSSTFGAIALHCGHHPAVPSKIAIPSAFAARRYSFLLMIFSISSARTMLILIKRVILGRSSMHV